MSVTYENYDCSNNHRKKTDIEMARLLGISRPSYQLYRTHPDRFPDYPLLTSLLDLLGWDTIFGYLSGKVTKKQLVKKVCALQDRIND